ncbi:ABC transporter substrate-binding protein [Cohnella phaseoli]|uniref:ABC-type glycerol-3-phosphate transport system substrate-binding protein n=1 Tax=Cohnella phaseoli TaxID=456490 RepID=A0A3D9I0A9_9BACL|nr:extracellular solute-binding protein [Cohnella phaseoli]RED55208.1 ABC-type glycerol-3-phosphate transport system substrate-binding protein [Cohnella phaseoli]
MRIKWLSTMLVAVMLVLAACSGGNGGGGNEPSQQAAPEASQPASPADSGSSEPSPAVEEPTPAPSDGPIDLKGRTIRIGQWWGMENYLSEEEKELQKKAEEKFNVKIEYVTVPFGEIQSRIITTSVAGQPFADIIMIPLEWSIPKMVSEGYIRNIDDLVDMADPNWNSIMLKYGKYNGKQYSFTDKDNNGHGFFYNKTLIQRNGLEDPYELQERGEWTWDKFLEMAKAVTKDGVFGVSEYDAPSSLAIPFIYSNNAAVTKDDQITYDAPEALEAIQFVSDLYNVHKVVGGKWAEGTTLFYPGYRWAAYDFNGSMADDWGYVFFPKGPNADNYVVPTTINMWHLMADVENPREVMAVWKELYERDIEKGFDAVIRAEEANFRNQEGLNTLRKMLGNGTVLQFFAYEGFSNYFNEAINNIMAGKGTPSSELARIKPLTQAAIDVTLKK